MSCRPTDVALSSAQNEEGEFVDAVHSASVEKALVRAVEMAEPCCELARSAKLENDLFKVLTSCHFSERSGLYFTG